MSEASTLSFLEQKDLNTVLNTLVTNFKTAKRRYHVARDVNPLTIKSGRRPPLTRSYGLSGYEPWNISAYYKIESYENDIEFYTYAKNYMTIRPYVIDVRKSAMWIKTIMDIKEKFANNEQSTIFNDQFIFTEQNNYNEFKSFIVDSGYHVKCTDNISEKCHQFVNNIGNHSFKWEDFNLYVDQFKEEYPYIMRLL